MSVDDTFKHLLQGRWMRHPLHPAIVHLVVGAWPAALVFDVLSILGIGGNPMVRVSFWCIAIGLCGSALAVPTGFADWWDIKEGRTARSVGLYHMMFMVAAFVIFGVDLMIRWRDSAWQQHVNLEQLFTTFFGNGMVMAGAWLGGRMSFEYGTSVARQSKQKWRRAAEAAGANVPEE